MENLDVAGLSESLNDLKLQTRQAKDQARKIREFSRLLREASLKKRQEAFNLIVKRNPQHHQYPNEFSAAKAIESMNGQDLGEEAC